VGFHKVDSGRPSITWPQSVDQALCFGWIDGVRKSLGATSYTIRFTPRRPRSIWSKVNLQRTRELIRAGLMRPAGRKALEARDDRRSGVYAYEQGTVILPARYLALLKRNRAAWAFYAAQPPGYRKITARFVLSAKQEATRQRRLARLIADSAAGRRIGLLQRKQV
jgi:uncharacterized protein YdeI (YjbR/CyaY-like superfamily)